MGHEDFEQRVARAQEVKPTKRKVRVLPSMWERMLYPMTFVGAFLLGYAIVVFTRWMRSGIHFEAQDPNVALATEAAAGIVVGFVIRQLFSIKNPVYVPANALGTTAAIISFHNFFWWFPEQAEMVFTPEYTQSIRATTEPNSLIFMGAVFD